MKSGRFKPHIIFLVSSLLFLCMVASVPFIRTVNRRSRIWKGYYMLLLPDDGSRGGFEDVLADAGFSYISEGNTTVPFFDYDGIEHVPIRNISSRFLPFDPRIDDYAKHISAYFTTSDGVERRSIIYVESDDSPLRFAAATGALLGRGEDGGIIADFNWRGTLLGLVMFMAVAACFVVWTGLPKILPVLAALPWIAFYLLGADSGNPGFMLMYAACMLVFECMKPLYMDKLSGGTPGPALPLWLGGVVVLSLIVSLAFASGVSGRRFAFLVIFYALAASVLLAAAYAGLLAMLVRRMEHRRFVPVPIIRGSTREDRVTGRRRVLILGALLLGSCILPAATERAGGFPIPVPVHHTAATDFSWTSLAELSGHEEAGELPDLADYLTHMAYQEGFPYNREYRFPQPGEAIEVLRYTRREGTIFSRTDYVKQFTEDWYEDIMADASSRGITALLMEQDYPAGVMTREIKKHALVPGNTREQLLVGLLALSPFAVDDVLKRGPAQPSATDIR